MKHGRHILIKFFPKAFPLLLVLWVLLVLYPDPTKLVASVQRTAEPQVDREAVVLLADEMPENPSDIEAEVRKLVPYSYDWETHGMPWYFPTVEEVLDKGRGDCKARALVTASILDQKGIPYRLQFSPIHMWVDYEGKEANSLENSDSLFYEMDPDTGERALGFPTIDLKESIVAFWDGFWPPMPLARKVLLTGGTGMLFTMLLVTLRSSRAANKRHLSGVSRTEQHGLNPSLYDDNAPNLNR